VARHELLRFGSDLVVVEPTELRDEMATVARQMLERYAPAPA
jgi:predicted DNA-binding transcriptional regulator YafY